MREPPSMLDAEPDESLVVYQGSADSQPSQPLKTIPKEKHIVKAHRIPLTKRTPKMCECCGILTVKHSCPHDACSLLCPKQMSQQTKTIRKRYRDAIKKKTKVTLGGVSAASVRQ